MKVIDGASFVLLVSVKLWFIGGLIVLYANNDLQSKLQQKYYGVYESQS